MAQQLLRRIRHNLHSGFRHLENAQLIDRPEAVFDRAQQPIFLLTVALEVQHDVHHVFQHSRPGNRAVLRHMPDKENRRAALLAQAHDLARAFANLAD